MAAIVIILLILERTTEGMADCSQIDMQAISNLSTVAQELKTGGLTVPGTLKVDQLQIGDGGPTLSWNSTNKYLNVPSTIHVNDSLDTKRNSFEPSLIVSNVVSTTAPWTNTWADGNKCYPPNSSTNANNNSTVAAWAARDYAINVLKTNSYLPNYTTTLPIQSMGYQYNNMFTAQKAGPSNEIKSLYYTAKDWFGGNVSQNPACLRDKAPVLNYTPAFYTNSQIKSNYG